MPLATCPRCKKMFNKESFAVCTDCEEDERADYQKIQDTLAEFPDLLAEELAEKAEVDVECVLRLVDTGRIEPVAMAQLQAIKCGRCGAPAISKTKKLCEACLSEMNAELAREQAKIKLPDKPYVDVGAAQNIRGTLEEKRNVSKQ